MNSYFSQELLNELDLNIDNISQNGRNPHSGRVNEIKSYAHRSSDGVDVENFHLIHIKPSEINLFSPSSVSSLGNKAAPRMQPFAGSGSNGAGPIEMTSENNGLTNTSNPPQNPVPSSTETPPPKP